MDKAKQSLMWTTLPNGLTEDGKGLCLSVLLSPRLEPRDDPRKLSSFPDWGDWPKTLDRATFKISYGGVEPDARGYPCEACETNTVVGLQEALLMGRISVALDEFAAAARQCRAIRSSCCRPTPYGTSAPIR